jgi:hypothetical protein
MSEWFASDLDDCVVNFIGGVRKSFQMEFGEEGIPTYSGTPWGQEVIDFYHHPYFTECGYEDWWGWLRDRDWLWGKVFDAMPGAVGAVTRLRHDGWKMEAISTKPKWAEFAVWYFQARWRVPFQRVTIVPMGERKVDWTDANIIVDDKLATCLEFNNANRSAIWFNQGEAGHTARPGLYEAKDWNQVISIARGFRDARLRDQG